jgi:hypothetical protein
VRDDAIAVRTTGSRRSIACKELNGEKLGKPLSLKETRSNMPLAI